MIEKDVVSSAATLSRHTIYYILGRLATGAIGLATLVAFTHVLNANEYGRYSVLLALGGLISSVGFQWLRQCLVRFGSDGTESCRQPLLGTLGTIFITLLVVLTAISIILVVLPANTLPSLQVSSLEILAVAGLAATMSWYEFSIDTARIDLRPWHYGASTFLRSLITLLLGTFVAIRFHDATLVLLALASAYLISSAFATPRWLSGMLSVRRFNYAEMKRLVAYGFPLAASLGIVFILDTADRLMLAGLRGYDEAGIYSAAYNFAQFSVGTVLSGLGLASLPLAVKAMAQTGADSVATMLNKNLLLGATIAIPTIAGLFTLAPGLGSLLLGNYISGQSDWLIRIIAVAIGLSAIRGYCIDIVYMLQRKTWVQGVVIFIAAIINVLMNFVLIPQWGAIGAAVASLVAFLVAFLGSSVFALQEISLSIKVSELVKICFSSLLMCLIMLAWFPNSGNLFQLISAILTGGAIYFISAVCLDVAGVRNWLSKRNIWTHGSIEKS